MTIARQGLCLVLAAPSGAGKTSVARALLAEEPELTPSISVTTRPPRPGEREGIDYRFLTEPAFAALVAQDGLLEWAKVLGGFSYGTPRAPVEIALAAGQDVLFDIDWQGHRSLRSVLPGQVLGVFLLPPSMAELRGRLLARRADRPEEIARRMALAREEISHCGEFDHILVNDHLDRTVASVRSVLAAARCATPRLTGLPGFLAGLA